MTLPTGIDRRTIAGDERLATSGPPVGSEPTEGEWRAWDVSRSKLGVLLDRGIDVGLRNTASVLYLGAASGTTVSHVADVTAPVYAVEFAPRPLRDLLAVARDRPGLFPLLKDARSPATYAQVVESNLDLIVQDVATRNQATVATENKQFLAADGHYVLFVKARSEDVTADPDAVFSSVLDDIRTTFEVERTESLDPLHADHLAVLMRPR